MYASLIRACWSDRTKVIYILIVLLFNWVSNFCQWLHLIGQRSLSLEEQSWASFWKLGFLRVDFEDEDGEFKCQLQQKTWMSLPNYLTVLFLTKFECCHLNFTFICTCHWTSCHLFALRMDPRNFCVLVSDILSHFSLLKLMKVTIKR